MHFDGKKILIWLKNHIFYQNQHYFYHHDFLCALLSIHKHSTLKYVNVKYSVDVKL